MPKVTVIMPSLNVVKYIRPCIESVLQQTLEEIEILAIDAGSTDGTKEIIEEYAQKDSRLKYIMSPVKSYGHQVNMGLEQAKGEYISIVETDDKIHPEMLETLYQKAEETGADYVKGRGIFLVGLTNENIYEYPIGSPLKDLEQEGTVIAPCEMPELLLSDIYLWTGLYRREFLKNIRLHESAGAAFQDQGFLFQTICAAKKAVYLDKAVYYYRQDNGNSSIVNPNGFRYLVGEYTYMKKFLTDLPQVWTKMHYMRMFNQCVGRFYMMAVHGIFWEEALADIKKLQEELRNAVEAGILQKNDMSASQWELLQQYLRSEREIFQSMLKNFQRETEILKQLLEKVHEKEIVIFGCGRYGTFAQVLLETAKPGQVCAFCDNNQALLHQFVQGIEVLSPEEAVRDYPNAVYVIANSRSVPEIKEQLENLGISEEHMFVYQQGVDFRLFNEILREENKNLSQNY